MNSKPYVNRSRMAAARVIGNETIVMSSTDSTLFTLDEVGTIVWEAADGLSPLEDIVREKICTQYDVAFDVALNDAEHFVQGLVDHGVLLVSDKPLRGPNNSPVEAR
jgi:hypothetical protein